MSKKILFFTAGIPDPSQGGTGIFNYMVIDYLLNAGYEVRSFFRAGESFIKNNCSNVFLEELVKRGLVVEMVYENSEERNYKLGLEFLKKAHNYDLCLETVKKNRALIENSQGCISLDLGWLLALSHTDKKSVSILGDPLQKRLLYAKDHSLKSKALRWARIVSLFNLYGRIKKDILRNKNMTVGFLSPQDARELQHYGINCKHFPFFTPPPSMIKTNYDEFRIKDEFVLLHVGNLATTASRHFIANTLQRMVTNLSALPFKVRLRFVGRCVDEVDGIKPPENVKIEKVGYLKGTPLEEEYVRADLFFSLFDYPVGVRTRIISAVSYGLPCIAFDNVRESMTGLDFQKDIFILKDVSSVSELLNTLHKNPRLLKEKGLNARKAWEKNYNPVINIPNIVKILEN